MNRKRFSVIRSLAAVVVVLLVMAIAAGCVVEEIGEEVLLEDEATPTPQQEATTIPTLTPAPAQTESEPAAQPQPAQELQDIPSGTFVGLYDQLNPGVVSIRVIVERQGTTGSGAGSGFILDEQRHIVTNSHVVAQAENIIVVFHNGFQAQAELVGTDPDSDLAVLQVDEVPKDAHPLPLADSDQVEPGELAIAIGNPFGQQGSMTVGVVSAVGRFIPSLAEGFSIPQAIQTDAAINPGNSGGPLLNLDGEVIGVNAQIRSGGARANSGVGFAVPSNIVRMITPVLIEQGSYDWPWVGIEAWPTGVGLFVARANDLDTQKGTYVHQVIPGGPAEQAGLQGSTGEATVEGLDIPVGGDVIIEADGETVVDFADLLTKIAFKRPGDTMELTIIRDGERQQVTVELEARPEERG